MKAQELLSLLASGLEAAAHTHTASSLGNRKTYLGISDLARGLACPRAVVARKLNGEPTSWPLETLLQLRRGHWLEYGIEEALSAAGQKFISQLEINIQHQGVPIKGHLDLLLVDEVTKSVTVIELKSVGRIRDQVYGSHEAQLYGQLGLLHRYWGQAAFANNVFVNGLSLPANSEYCSFPELASRQLGIQLPKDADSISIHGFVLTVAPKEARVFGPYEPNPKLLEIILDSGLKLWKGLADIKAGLATLDDQPIQQGFSPLCDYCTDNSTCLKFQGASHPALEPELSALADLKARRSRLEEEIKEREDQLKAIAAIMGKSGQWINGDRYRFKVSRMPGRATLDQQQLKSRLGQLKQVDENQLDSLLASAQKISRPFERLQLSPIN